LLQQIWLQIKADATFVDVNGQFLVTRQGHVSIRATPKLRSNASGSRGGDGVSTQK
jgi:hypothetical protein